MSAHIPSAAEMVERARALAPTLFARAAEDGRYGDATVA